MAMVCVQCQLNTVFTIENRDLSLVLKYVHSTSSHVTITMHTQAAKKGASSTVIGLVFSSFEMAMFLGAPVYGNFVSVVHPHTIAPHNQYRNLKTHLDTTYMSCKLTTFIFVYSAKR